MDARQFDTIAKSLGMVTSRRGAMSALLGGALGLLGWTESEAGQSSKCKPACGECQSCKKGICRKKHGKKKCKRGKCRPVPNGLACQNNPCKECQNGVCANKPAGTRCEDNPCRECRDGVCANKANDTVCDGVGRCLNGTCNARPDCVGFGDTLDFICVSDEACCSEVCNELPTLPFGYCAKAASGKPCTANVDCSSNRCVGYRCA